jgi:signal transduction histidine kinase/DNA-binding NarL/FixJ family response regulator
MLGAEADRLSFPAEASRSALDFLHALLAGMPADMPPLGSLLAGLAKAFGAAGAGIAVLPEGTLVERHSPIEHGGSWPWQDDKDLASRLPQAPLAQPLHVSNGVTLLIAGFGVASGAGWLLWLEDTCRTQWAPAEAAVLTLAGQALARWLPATEDSPCWARQLDRAARQQRLEQAAQITRRLAHDFGNVLTGILGFSELALSQHVAPNSILFNYLSEVHKGAQGGASLTQVLRLFSRRQAVPTRSCTLQNVLPDAEARLRQAAGTSVRFQANLPQDLPTVGMDAEQLRQVLIPLLDNAREAVSGPGQPADFKPEITLTARVVELDSLRCRDYFGDAQPGRHLEVVVADNGPGLSPEAQRKIFAEPFFSSRSRRRGFGLASAYGVLCAHRGGLDLRSRAASNGHSECRGAEARFVIPVAQSPVVEVPAPPSAPSARPRGERVLVVDDDAILLQFVTRTLERAGYRTHPTATGDEALRAHELAGGDPFRLVLTDVLMPGLNGVELAHRLLRRDAGTRLVFMSGQVSMDYIQQAFQGVACDVLTKPFRPEGLLRAVRAALERADQNPPRVVAGKGEPSIASLQSGASAKPTPEGP